MSSIGDLGLEDSCELAIDIGKSNKQTRDFTQLQALDRGNPTCCLSDLFIWKIFGLQWGGSRRRQVWLGFDVRLVAVVRLRWIDCVLGFLSRAFI